jgi:hypothetical protein
MNVFSNHGHESKENKTGILDTIDLIIGEKPLEPRLSLNNSAVITSLNKSVSLSSLMFYHKINSKHEPSY